MLELKKTTEFRRKNACGIITILFLLKFNADGIENVMKKPTFCRPPRLDQLYDKRVLEAGIGLTETPPFQGFAADKDFSMVKGVVTTVLEHHTATKNGRQATTACCATRANATLPL